MGSAIGDDDLTPSSSVVVSREVHARKSESNSGKEIRPQRAVSVRISSWIPSNNERFKCVSSVRGKEASDMSASRWTGSILHLKFEELAYTISGKIFVEQNSHCTDMYSGKAGEGRSKYLACLRI